MNSIFGKRNAVFALASAAVLAIGFALPGGSARADTGSQEWVVAFNQTSSLPANVDQMVANDGGTIETKVPEIGGILASSTNPNFGATISSDPSVKSADIATATQLIDPVTTDDGATNPNPNGNNGNNGGTYSPAGPDPQPMPDSLGNQQWDKMRMDATLTGSYAVQQGRPDVRIAVLDTGTDQSHIDIAPNLDTADSRSFVPSEPDIQDRNGHGTWTMSAVGAPINGVGISGVAPKVSLVSLKVLSGAGRGLFIWLDQALVYSGEEHFDVASMSLGGYIPKCGSATNPNGCDHPDYILLNRAIQFARSNGVLPVAAMGNDNFDVSAGYVFQDYVEAPGTMPGVVGVSATGYYNQKAWYSNYGMGNSSVDVSAPGGSTRDYTGVPGSGSPPPPYNGLGRLIGAWSSTASSSPANPVEQCVGPSNTPPCYLYAYVQGTSMATPNAAGVAALIISQYGNFSSNNPNQAHMSPTTVEQYLQISANNQPCPTPNTVVTGPGTAGGTTATCQGGTGDNSFFGKGIVDALRAVTLKNNP